MDRRWPLPHVSYHSTRPVPLCTPPPFFKSTPQPARPEKFLPRHRLAKPNRSLEGAVAQRLRVSSNLPACSSDHRPPIADRPDTYVGYQNNLDTSAPAAYLPERQPRSLTGRIGAHRRCALPAPMDMPARNPNGTTVPPASPLQHPPAPDQVGVCGRTSLQNPTTSTNVPEPPNTPVLL